MYAEYLKEKYNLETQHCNGITLHIITWLCRNATNEDSNFKGFLIEGLEIVFDDCTLFKKVEDRYGFIKKVYKNEFEIYIERTQDNSIIEQYVGSVRIEDIQDYNKFATVLCLLLPDTFTLFPEYKDVIANEPIWDYIANDKEVQEWIVNKSTEEIANKIASVKYGDLEAIIRECQIDIADILKSYQDKLGYLELVQNQLIFRDGFEKRILQSIRDITTFIKKHKGMEYEWDKTNGVLRVSMRGVCSVWNESLAVRIYEREQNAFPTNLLVLGSTLLYKALFIDRVVQLKLSAMFLIDLVNKDVNYQTTNNAGCEYVPNPHMAFYNCWSEGERQAIELINKEQYIDMLVSLYSSAMNINLADSAVMSRFTEYLERGWKDCKIFTYNGKDYTYSEIIKELEDESNDDEQC